MSKIRYFIGLPTDDVVREQLAEQVEHHKTSLQFAKWTHPQDYHITLAFLGDIEESKATEVRGRLQKHTFLSPSFTLRIKQWGSFGPTKKPSILWAGVELSDALHHLHEEVWSVMETIGFIKDERPFRPHITLARRSQGTTAQGIQNTQVAKPLPKLSWQIGQVTLFQTHFGRQPAYEQVLSFPLRTGDPYPHE